MEALSHLMLKIIAKKLYIYEDNEVLSPVENSRQMIHRCDKLKEKTIQE